ncbi:MAG TPA: response regulator [Puia sp.]|nr:response regulator [Puia sp.]
MNKKLCLQNAFYLKPYKAQLLNEYDMRKKVVVAEDDPGLQDVLKIILENAGYDVQIFSKGELIMQRKFSIPDLFLLDKQLSGIDGIDICKFLKAHPTTRHIPVVMISANPNIAELATGAGADNWIEKPFEVKTLLEMVRNYSLPINHHL